MRFRTRLTLGFGAAVLVPLIVFALGIRKSVRERLTAQYERRVASLVAVIEEDLARESQVIAERLATLTVAMADDNRFRAAAVTGVGSERSYLLDYAGEAMHLTGLSMLQIQDEAGRILSSGHFRNEFDRLEPGLPRALSGARADMALVQARSPEGPFLALARADSFRLGGRWFTLVGGIALGRRFLSRLAHEQELAVSLLYPGGVLSSAVELERNLSELKWTGPGGSRLPELEARFSDQVVGELEVPFVSTGGGGERESRAMASAVILVTQPLTPLVALRRSIDLWFLFALAVTAVTALVAASWFSSRISRPISELARKTTRVDLDRLNVDFSSERSDEVGALSRLLGAMTERLRTGAVRLREAERLATLGDVARQVNHDIRNGLTPIRNVFRHLAQVVRDEPENLPAVFGERQGTLESSISYLETLATNYARLTPRVERRPCDVNAVIHQALEDARVGGGIDVRERLSGGLPPVLGDPMALRRIVENLVVNAVESLDGQPGTVTVATDALDGSPEERLVRITVDDTGSGMNEDELEKIFDDFYTTKEGGTGLGLSIVRRLVLDLSGTLRVKSEPGTGTRFVVELPAANASASNESGQAADEDGRTYAVQPEVER